MKLREEPALILIDIQKAFDDLDYWGGQRNNLNAEDNAAKLLQFWRKKQWPLIHIRHCSSNPHSPLVEGKTGNEFKPVVAPLPGEPIISKNVNSAFIGTDLKERLDKEGIQKLVIVGLTTDHCVSTTTRMAGNYGYDTYIVSDATATFNKAGANGQQYSAELIHETALASLNDEFATVIETEALINRLS